MAIFNVPNRDEVSESNQAIFDNLKSNIGFVPNLYATFAYSDTALNDYLQFQNRKSSLKAKEREVINLVVSEFNDCEYCLAAHTAIGKMNGFSDEDVLELRTGNYSKDEKINALASFVKDISINKSHPSKEALDELLNQGYTKENVVDIIIVIGDKVVSNYLNGVTQIPVDFPAAPKLEEVLA